MIACTVRGLWRTALFSMMLAGLFAAGPLAAFAQNTTEQNPPAAIAADQTAPQTGADQSAPQATTADAAAADPAEKVDDPPPPPAAGTPAPQEAPPQEPAPAQVEAPPAPRGPRYLPTILQQRSPVRDHQRIIQKRVWSWQEIQDRNVVKQDRDYSCGAASLCTIMRYYWENNITEQRILDELDKMLDAEETHDRIQNGLSLTDLRQVSVKLGYVASIGTVSFEQLCKSKIPLLVPLKIEEFNHFAVFRGTDGYYVYLADPARGNVRTPIDEFVKEWQKNAVLVVAKKDRDLNENAPLNLQPEEPYLGTLNRVEIQKLVARPIVIMPAVIRP